MCFATAAMTSFSLATGGHCADRYPSSPRRLRQFVFPQVCILFLNSRELGWWSDRSELARTWHSWNTPTPRTFFILKVAFLSGPPRSEGPIWETIFERGAQNCVLRNMCLFSVRLYVMLLFVYWDAAVTSRLPAGASWLTTKPHINVPIRAKYRCMKTIKATCKRCWKLQPCARTRSVPFK
jgi:hypothetical protein